MNNEVIIGYCKDVLKSFEDGSIDCIVTDPPYGYSFMGLSWDKALPSEEALRECCRVFIGIDSDVSNKPLMEARGQINAATLDTFADVV